MVHFAIPHTLLRGTHQRSKTLGIPRLMTLLTRLTLPPSNLLHYSLWSFSVRQSPRLLPLRGTWDQRWLGLDPLAALLSAWVGFDWPPEGTWSEVNLTWTVWVEVVELLMDTNQCLVCSRYWSGDHPQAPTDQRRWQARGTVQTLQRPRLGLSQ